MRSSWPTLALQRHYFMWCFPLAPQAPRAIYLATAICSTNSGPWNWIVLTTCYAHRWINPRGNVGCHEHHFSEHIGPRREWLYHGLVICAGDQLSLALFDKVCICISVVSLFDYLIRFRPFDATTTTSWIISDSILRVRTASVWSQIRKR